MIDIVIDWCCLMFIDAIWCWVKLIYALWLWLMLIDLIDVDWCWFRSCCWCCNSSSSTRSYTFRGVPSSLKRQFSDYYDIKRFLCICFCNVLPHRQFRCMQIYAWCKSAYLHKICLKMPPDPTHPLPSRSERRLPDRRPTYNGLLPPVPNIDVIITAFLISAANPDTWSLSLLARTMSVKVIMW